MSTGQEELITEEDAARYLGISPERLIELVTQGELHLVTSRKRIFEISSQVDGVSTAGNVSCD